MFNGAATLLETPEHCGVGRAALGSMALFHPLCTTALSERRVWAAIDPTLGNSSERSTEGPAALRLKVEGVFFLNHRGFLYHLEYRAKGATAVATVATPIAVVRLLDGYADHA